MTCESCGADDHDLTPVHRKYVTLAPGGDTTVSRVLDEVEHWCISCRTQYPHEPVGG
ncbi:MAG: hypothetical protein R8G01_15460 [Ilumatobacteraceae bacterium]|nr:hypothetical protein [Ilumatobacteraceae bacterium]